MYVDVTVLDQECVRLACLLANRGMDRLTLPPTRSPEDEGEALEEKFGAELGKSYLRLAAAKPADGDGQQAVGPRDRGVLAERSPTAPPSSRNTVRGKVIAVSTRAAVCPP
ncbi:hypothetical protein [Kitasatospora sp. NPDC087314]|uniref:hypothetical protein n=1 Tax=Kitasatospora sp. NPDC087314 TaxID=3364068 RepID=UPI00382F9E2F